MSVTAGSTLISSLWTDLLVGFAFTSGRTVFVNGLEVLRDPEHSDFIELTLTAATSSVFTAFDSGNSTFCVALPSHDNAFDNSIFDTSLTPLTSCSSSLGLSSFVDDPPSLWH